MEAEYLELISKGGGSTAKLAYAEWLLARGDARGEIIQLAELTASLPDHDPRKESAFQRLYDLTRNIDDFTSESLWFLRMGYENQFKFWKPFDDARNYVGQQVRCQRGENADANRSGFRILCSSRDRLDLVSFAQYHLRSFDDGLADFGQQYVSRVPLHQRHSELIFEFF